MNDVIEVNYKEITELTDKTTEALTAEANTIWEQMEMIGNLGIQLAVQAGSRLNVIKERLKHGEWESWARENLAFSLSKANRMMKLALKAEDENSLFSNPSTFTDIGISKVWALLGTSEEVAGEVIENPETAELSVRELKEEIKKIEAEKKNTEAEKAELEKQNKDLINQNYEYGEKKQELAKTIMEQDDKLAEYVKETLKLKTELSRLKENPLVDNSVQKELEEKLAEVNKKLSDATKQLELEKQKLSEAESGKETEIEEAIREAKAKAEAEHESEIRKLKEKHAADSEEQEKEIHRLKEAAKKNSDTDLIEFKIKSDILQTDFNDCMKAITAVEVENPQQAEKMKTALKKVMEALESRI